MVTMLNNLVVTGQGTAGGSGTGGGRIPGIIRKPLSRIDQGFDETGIMKDGGGGPKEEQEDEKPKVG